MKIRANKIILAAFALAATVSGCKKQIDINSNPNQPGSESITADLILPNALHATGAQTAVGFLTITGNYADGYGWLNNWMGYFSPSGSFSPTTEESSYNITNTFQETKWSSIYNVLFDLDQAKQKAIRDNQQFYRAMAMIMEAHLYQNLVDIYGNIPYSQAFKTLEFPTPAYDKAEDIYASLQLKLDTAISIMETAPIIAAYRRIDICYGGETGLWIKLANTIKLRLLIRASEINPNPTAELIKIKAKGGVIQSNETADVNPGYVNDINKQNPYFSSYGLLPNGNEANSFFRANRYIINTFKQNNDTVRLRYFFQPATEPTNAADSFIGTVYGAVPDVAFNGDRTSNIGKGLAKSPEQAQWVVTSVESMFLQAEAIERGWDVGGPYTGNARNAYEAAVRESFIWLGIPNAVGEANSYLTRPAANWANAGASSADRVKFIVLQKYLSLTGLNPLEAWSDYRRLGIPVNVPLSVNSARGGRLIPVRLIYPSNEFAVNVASVRAQGNIDPQTSKIFWDK